jgi:hypothetical protein
MGCESEQQKTKINFNNKVIGKLPIEFHPLQPYAKLRPGESTKVVYRFVNISPEPITVTIKAIASEDIQIIEGIERVELKQKQVRDIVLTFRISSKNLEQDLTLNLEASSL